MSVLCGGDYTGFRMWSPAPMRVNQGNNTGMLQSNTLPDRGNQDTYALPRLKSTKKRLRSKSPTPPLFPTVAISPTKFVELNMNPTGLSQQATNPFLSPESLSRESPQVEPMEIRTWMENVAPLKLIKLQEEQEDTLHIGTISNNLLAKWMTHYSGDLHSDNIRYEYNFISGNFNIKCLPLPTHDSLQIFFAREVSVSLAERFGRAQARKMVSVASGTTFSGFTGDGYGTSRKLPDVYIKLPGQQFPTVVCEVGWSESLDELRNDARLWLLHTNGETKIVIIISFTEKKPPAPAASSISSGPPTLSTPNDESNEQRLLKSINNTTDLRQLAAQLFQLNQDGELQQALLGEITATLYIYKADECNKDIVKTFSMTLLPVAAEDKPDEDREPIVNPVSTTLLPITAEMGPDQDGGDIVTTISTTLLPLPIEEKADIDGEHIVNTFSTTLLPVAGERGSDQGGKNIVNTVSTTLLPLPAGGESVPDGEDVINTFSTTLVPVAGEGGSEQDGEDIVDPSSTALLPVAAEPKSTPKYFTITLQDMLGDNVPEGHSPQDEMRFPLEDLLEDIQSTLPETARLRATDRAINLLKSKGWLDEETTFSQRKRQRLGPVGQRK
ncbi:hypothetical protein B9Z19DRAFT_1069742 [Tuber borchii]|uniref:Uncharacterized protein n=1 Tax=Tuber borchii TaxID=42251 RepID=A0A2T6ZAF7_TUBBO|nr:hypothetical protein B9Z19DRAFT_1069742 [Tuber borchii]